MAGERRARTAFVEAPELGNGAAGRAALFEATTWALTSSAGM